LSQSISVTPGEQVSAEKLAEILGLHLKWLRGEPGGERADLRSANLGYADLRYANLRSANLRSANLRSANLRYADLRSANLGYANLRSANLGYANLRSANLRSANLRSANLRSADLGSANLRSANLGYANLGDLRAVQIGPIGSRRDTLTVLWGKWHDGTAADQVMTGCFKGTLAEFEQAVEQQHGEGFHGQSYRMAVALARQLQTVEVPA
jgi:uncharacterized protein YjbI with pentapeptide repeats